MHYFSSTRCMPIFILVRQLVVLVCINSALIMSPPARTINKTPLNHPTKGESLITIQNTTKHALLSSHQRPPNGGIFYYFLYCDLIEYQSIRNQKAPLLRIMLQTKTTHHKLNRYSLNICIIIGSQRMSFLTSYLKFDQSLVN